MFEVGTSHSDKCKFRFKEVLGSARRLDGVDGAVRVNAVAVNENRNKHEVKFVVKDGYIDEHEEPCFFGFETKEMPDPERYYERWRYLKKIGVPTVSSMRVSGNKILMGDMTADGDMFFDKHSNLEIKYLLGDISIDQKRPLTTMESSFLEIDPNKIKQELKRIHEIAWNNGVVLPEKDKEQFAILLSQSGEWKAIVRDLTYLRKVRENDDSDELLDRMYKQVDDMRENLLKIKL